MEEELKINKEPNITRPDLPDYVGPDEGKAEHTVGPLEVAAGAVIAPGLVMKAAKAWGAGKVLDAGMQIAFPDAEDTKLEQALDFNKPVKTGIKATRLMYENVLKDADVYSKSRFSSRLKREAGKKIIEDYLQKKVVEGPHKAWQDQNIPQTELSKDISDLSKRTDAQFNKKGIDDGYSIRGNRALKNPIWDNLTPTVQNQFTDAGIDSDKAKFFIENWTREVGANVEGFPFTNRTFEFMQGQLLPKILEDMKGVDLSDGLQLDHIAQLKAMTPFYQGRNLKQAEKIRRILIKEGIFGGHNPKNLKYLPTDVHTVKTRFWEDQVGKDGSKFFKGRPMRTYADVEKAAKEMKQFINRSNKIVENLSVQYKLMRGKNISNDELWKLLQKVDLNKGPYNLKDVRKLIDEIDVDYAAGNVPSALGGKSQSPPTQVPQVKSVSQRQQDLNQLKELRDLVKNNKKNYNKQELAQMKQTIKALSDQLEGKQKNIFNQTGL